MPSAKLADGIIFYGGCNMKTELIILVLAIMACNDSAGSRQTGNDSTTNKASLDTPAAPPPVATAPDQNDTTTLRGTWFLQAVLSSDTATGKVPRLEFDLNSRQLTGNTGCNSLRGSFIYTDTSLAFNKDIVMTKMACVGYNEKAFLESLLRTNRYKLDNGMLILLFDETELSRWTRKVAPKPVSNRT